MAKATTAAELRSESREDLNKKVVELKEELFTLRFQAATSQLEKSSRVREVRRDIARIKTLQSQRSAEANRGQTERARSAKA